MIASFATIGLASGTSENDCSFSKSGHTRRHSLRRRAPNFSYFRLLECGPSFGRRKTSLSSHALWLRRYRRSIVTRLPLQRLGFGSLISLLDIHAEAQGCSGSNLEACLRFIPSRAPILTYRLSRSLAKLYSGPQPPGTQGQLGQPAKSIRNLHLTASPVVRLLKRTDRL